jgi:hypothetical protein
VLTAFIIGRCSESTPEPRSVHERATWRAMGSHGSLIRRRVRTTLLIDM